MKTINHVLAFCFFSISNIAFSRVYNYADHPVGERASGMGMTALAASSDVGDAYLNPAAVADLKAPMIGASVSSYSRIDARTGDPVSIFESVKDSIVKGSVETIPAFVGGNFNTNGWVWGGGIVMPSTLSFKGTLDQPDNSVVSYSALTRATHLLTFVSRRKGDFSYGVSLTGASITEQERFFELSSLAPNALKNVEYYYSLNLLISGLGVVWDASPGFRIGLSASLPIALLGGDGTFAEVESGAADHTVQAFTMKNHPFPLRISAGTEWIPNSKFSFAFDIHWFSGFNRDLAPSAPYSLLKVSAKPIVNLNFGVQWRGWSRVGLRGGVFTNLSSSKKVFSKYATLQDSVDMYGATLAVYFPTPNGSISLGGFVQGGQGKMTDFTTSDSNVGTVGRSIYVYGALLGSTYLFL